MSVRITYYKRVVDYKVKELHYHEDKGDYMKGKSYPESIEVFNDNELEELSLNEWLDEGLALGFFKSDDLAPKHSC